MSARLYYDIHQKLAILLEQAKKDDSHGPSSAVAQLRKALRHGDELIAHFNRQSFDGIIIERV